MVKENLALKSLKFIVSETVVDVFRWIFWWYGSGLKKAWHRALGFIAQGNAELALSVWVKNIFRPMFGQYDWQGRLISFFVRLFQIIARVLVFTIWVAVALATLIFWVILPLVLLASIMFYAGLITISI